MKKYAVAIIIFFTMSHSLFAQYFEYVSAGYNSVEITNAYGSMISSWHYFISDPRFSRLAYDNSYHLLRTERSARIDNKDVVIVGSLLGSGDVFYPHAEEGFIDLSGRQQIFRLINGRLSYIRWSGYTFDRIEYTDTGVTATTNDRNINNRIIMRFYNIPEEQLYSMFMSYLASAIDTTITTRSQPDSVIIENVRNNLHRITRAEVELFKSRLLARHQHSFIRGFRSVPEALSEFNFRELRLMEIIQREFAEQYFVLGDYYRTQENLRLRVHPNLEADTILIINRGEWVQIIEEGEIEIIDDLTSAWVKIKLQNATEGWSFGGYLGY